MPCNALLNYSHNATLCVAIHALIRAIHENEVFNSRNRRLQFTFFSLHILI